MTPPSTDIGQDSIIWGLEPSGRFTIRSAYLLLKELQGETPEQRWKGVWNWQGPNKLIGWRPSNEGWFTLSTDGSLRSPTKLAAAGGVIRTDTGCFVKAFAANLGSCSITRAEMRAIVDGLQLAWSLGIRRIKVQSDSMSAISILAKVSELDHQHAALVLQFKELCSRQWDVHLSHIYREANYAADYLANLGHSFSYGLHLFDYPDRDLSHWLHYDLIGVSLPRLVRTPNNI
ncbi:Putative ribonuclease H protein At1g65750 [Linum grandiflorum]